MNKKMLMLMANTGKGEKGRRVGVEYEDWGMKSPVYSDEQFAYRGGYAHPRIDQKRMSSAFDEGERRMNNNTGVPSVASYRHQETDHMQGPADMQEYSAGSYTPRFDRQMAEEWAADLENEDGTTGPHWTLDQAKQVMAQKDIGGSPIEFWAALNATYSDLCKVFGINNMDAYVDFAKAFWLDDKDSVPNKLAAYYEYIVRR